MSLALALVLAACNLNPPEADPNYFPPGNAKVAWTTLLTSNEIITMTSLVLDGDYLYQFYEPSMFAKIKASDGTVVWRKSFPYRPGTTPVRVGNYFYALERRDLWVFTPPTDRNPMLMRTGLEADDPVEAIDLGPAPEGSILNNFIYNSHFQQHGGVLYWGSMNNGVTLGLLALDPALDVAMTDGHLKATPRVVFPTDYRIQSPIVFCGSVAVFGGTTDRGIVGDPQKWRIFGFDLVTGEKLWDQTPAIPCYSTAALLADGERVYVFGLSGSKWIDARTGVALWDNPQLRLIGDGGVARDGDQMFGVYGAGGPDAFVDNKSVAVNAWSATTGELLWQDAYTEEQLGPTPQLYGDKLFLVSAASLLVYNSKTGKRLYRDADVRGDGYAFNNTLRYGDLMIFANNFYVIAVDLSKS